MSLITLKPLDDGQKAVEIPLGKTTIGRGTLLGCSDKKVSRNHAILEVTVKREVFLTPTHVNPCFYQPTADSPGQILKKDVPHKLENGDSFSLLPRAYRYQLLVQSPAGTPNNQSDNMNKPSEKTNGSTEAEDPQTESNKDTTKSVGDKPPDSVKEDTVASIEVYHRSIEKNHSKEDSHSSQDDLDNKPSNEESDVVKKTANNIIVKENNLSSDSKENTDITEMYNNDNKSEDDLKENADFLKDSDAEDEKSTSPEKSAPAPAPDKDAAPTEVPQDDETPCKDVSEGDNSEDKLEEMEDEEKVLDDSRQSLEDETLDTVASKDSAADVEAEKSQAVVERAKVKEELKESPSPTKTTPRKRGPAKGTKRKAATTVSDIPAKPRGRKKSAKFNFSSGDEGKPQRQAPERMSSRTNRQTRQGLSLEDFVVSDDDEWQSDNDRSRPKRRRKKGSRRGDESGSDWETDHKKAKKTPMKGGSGSESGSDWGLTKKGKKGLKGRRKKGKSGSSDLMSEDEDLTANITVVKKNRINCTYGKKCFRRNQNHIDQFSHPGDSDYASDVEVAKKNDAISESDEETASPKKECPYGANCFRKNPQHKKDFKHTKKVRPQREAAKVADKKAKGSTNSDEIDSYDLDESLRDDSADEYKPADSGSDYESGKKPKRLSKAKIGGKTKRGRKV